MTPEQEGALYREFIATRHYDTGELTAFRLAIRAAYAQGREDAAKVCNAISVEVRPSPEWRDKRPEEAMIDDARAYAADSCAAAIRRGE